MDLPRLSAKEYATLDLLRDGREMYGLELVEASKGALKRGTVYVLLTRISDKGYVSSRTLKEDNQSGIPRRLYQITGHGLSVLRAVEAARAAASEFWTPLQGRLRHV